MVSVLQVWSLILALFVASGDSHCPETEQGLIKWSDHQAAWSGSAPVENEHVIIDKAILLDEQPPTLWSINITKTGKLVWDPNSVVHLRIHWIQVDGELHIGAEHCPFEQNTHITFLGNVEENDLGAGGDKALFVTAGGTLEIHGKPKLSWTKLTQTAPKYDVDTDAVVSMMDLGPDEKAKGRGIIVYNISPTTGKLEDSVYYNFNAGAKDYPQLILTVINFLNDIPSGNIIGLALKRPFSGKADSSNLIEAIEILSGQTSGSGPLSNGGIMNAAYALLTIKGSPELSKEAYTSMDQGEAFAEVALSTDDYYVVLTSDIEKGGGMGKVFLTVTFEDRYRPVLNLLEDASTWGPGDKIVIASTDYDWKQAEVMTVVECSSCSNNQVRLKGPLKFTHFGEIYKNVDMRGEVGLLSRNILFDSEDAEGTTTYGGNLKVLKGFKSVHIEHAEFDDLGQQEVLGRYPLHFHMCEDVDQDEATRPWLKHNSIHHSNSRCVTIHGTHGLIVEDNVCYMTMGHAYFLEDGGEKRTILDGNLGLGQEQGSLLLSDKSPTTFWITNPIVNVRNNAAAGGQGRGFWLTYPRLPLGPSKDKGFMLQDQARHTAITEFDNNVAHSYRSHGFFADNEFQEDGSASDYNRYRPVADPIMHLQYGNSTDVPAIFSRMTGYKNAPRNVWLRGGMIKVVHASLSDSPQLLTITKENPAIQYVEKSVLIGDSPNLGEPAIINGQPVSIGRSFPEMNKKNIDKLIMANWRTGMALRNGPIHIKDVFFDDFTDNEYYRMGAVGFDLKKKQSPMHSFTNVLFGFSDPSEGNRVLIAARDESESIKDDERSFRDAGYSVTEVDGAGGIVTVLNAFPLHMTDGDCKIRSNWNMAVCKHAYGEIEFTHPSFDNVITMTRDDDYLTAKAAEDQADTASFLAIVGEGYGYSVFWENEVPEDILINGRGVSRSQTVRIGMCLPPQATFKIVGSYSATLKYSDRHWVRVNSIAEVTDIKTYFFDDDTGYLSILMSAESDFEHGMHGHCPGKEDSATDCPKIRVTGITGDRTKTDCLEQVHQKFDLSSSSESASKRRLHKLLDILTERLRLNRKKRSADADLTDIRELAATASDPPPDWGAGATR